MPSLPPIPASIVSRQKPVLPWRPFYSLQEIQDYSSDLACWKADQAERYLVGIDENQ